MCDVQFTYIYTYSTPKHTYIRMCVITVRAETGVPPCSTNVSHPSRVEFGFCCLHAGAHTIYKSQVMLQHWIRVELLWLFVLHGARGDPVSIWGTHILCKAKMPLCAFLMKRRTASVSPQTTTNIVTYIGNGCIVLLPRTLNVHGGGGGGGGG